MRKFLWRLRFALRMKERAAMPLREGFSMAGSWIESADWDHDPADAADEEISCWSE